MSTQLIQPPIAVRRAMQATRPQTDFLQRMLRSFLSVCEDIGRDRARRELGMLAMSWDTTHPELARHARLAAANCMASRRS